MIGRGYTFTSNTDTEVLIHLIEDIQVNEKVDLIEALRITLSQVIGAYAIVIISQDNPDMLIAAKKASPLVVGIGDNEFFVASDATPIIEYTSNVVYLNDEEIANETWRRFTHHNHSQQGEDAIYSNTGNES